MQPTKVVGRRVGAMLIDSVIWFAFYTAVYFALAQDVDDVQRGLGPGEEVAIYLNLNLGDTEYSLVGGDFWIWALIVTIVGVLYWMILPGLKGWTLGKLITGIRVVKDDGTCPAGVGKNVVRQLLWIADYFPYFIPYLAGFIVALTNDRNKRVGDIVAGTLVVRADAAGQPLAAQPAGYAGAVPGGGQPAPGGAPLGGRPAAAAGPGAGGATAADWYPDPKGEKRLRYWDGSAWTEHTAD